MRRLVFASLLALAAPPVVVACAGDRDEGPPPGAEADGGAGRDGEGPGRADGAVEEPGFDGAATPVCVPAELVGAALGERLADDTGAATVTVEGTGCARSFALASTAPRRDDLPASPRPLREVETAPTVHTGNTMFDALYQLALDEARENSVAEIKDYAFRAGAPVACAPGGCFETGRKWNYVWTRDTSYAVDLGLGWVDPARAKSSLDFKLSARRDGTDPQIVQDTGTGGSWPVSTDRAVWAVGAREVLRFLDGAPRADLRDRAFVAVRNTIEHDRAVVFDAESGLYRGEQSFLDWREQTYPAWTVPDLARIADGRSSSTNLTHLVLLETGAALSAERGDSATAQTLRQMATALRGAIKQKLWIPEAEGLSTFVPGTLDAAPVRRFDLLGTSLAILEGVLSEAEGRAALSRYPTFEKGPAVVHPSEPGVPVYHNRGIWPFVTAYWAKAGRKVGHDGVVTAAVRSLVRGAALNLSNMENLEATTGKAHHEEGATSGPVVNSQRQLWSVAGYLGMVNGVLFGVEATDAGLVVRPAVTKALRRAELAAARTIALDNLPWHGKRVTVVVKLPDATAGEGLYAVTRVRLNGKTQEGGVLREADLAARNLVEVELAEPAGPALAVVTLKNADRRTWEAPRTPSVTGVSVANGKLVLGLDRGGEAAADVTYAVYRDGVRVAAKVAGTEATYVDATSTGATSPSHCYTVDTTFVNGGTTSHRAAPVCFWGAGNERITPLPATGFTATGGAGVSEYGRFHYQGWGDAGHRLVTTFTAARSGAHLVQATYGNGAGGLTTGITCAVKRLDVEDAATGAKVATGYLVMPHRGAWDSWGESTFVKATLAAGKTYRLVLSTDERSVNMSSFAHFADYTAGTGGTGGAFGRVNVAELKVLGLTN